ncbi:MAG: hypothetical protein M0R74_18865, partial [Dehalococcoidia bacterium]|nr:hypothetical protein [Dehalococcoidia bacterium]
MAVAHTSHPLGRPHWIVIDEAHHMFYKPGIARELLLGEGFRNVVLAALDPAGLDASLLKRVSHLVSLGTEPERGIAAYCSAVGLPLPRIAAASDRCGVVWAVEKAARQTSLP